MRSVAGVALIAPARGRASKKIINIMHTGAARCFWKPKWPWVKTKPPKPPKPSTTGRAVPTQGSCSERCTFPVSYPVLAPERGPGFANPRPTRNLGISVRPGHPARAATLPGYSPRPPPGGSRLWFVDSGTPWSSSRPLWSCAPSRGLSTRLSTERGMKADSMPKPFFSPSRIASQPRSCLPGAVTSAEPHTET